MLNHKKEEMIRGFANQDKSNWDEHLIHFEVVNNSSVHTAITYTTIFLTYEQYPRTLLIETLEASNPSAESYLQAIRKKVKCANENIQQNNERMAE